MSFRSAVADLAAAARAHGDRIAVESHDAPPLGYAELLAHASALAASLRADGLGRGDLIGLDLDKSAAYVVALVGVWLAGAAFLPLDPRLPPERRRFILEDAAPRRLLGIADVTATRGAGGEATREDAGPDDLAYVIYTSGSTGTPKGVLVPHRGLPGLLHAQIAAFGLVPGSRALAYLSTSFDASISDLGTALLSGATLVIERAERLASAAGLLETLDRRRITHADLPPALLPAIDPERLPGSLSTVIIGGEPCPPAAVRRWARRVRVINVYGPTEATVCSSLGLCDADTWTRPLLGSPLPGVVYRVVDASLAPVPDGTPGELAIGGVGLAHGYLGRPDLTEQRFVTLAGGRFYRTGDRVVRGADGELEFLGRLDRQVKLRGRRIELEEIEARLRAHVAVEAAAVVARPWRLGAAERAPLMLVAFVVLRDAGASDAEPSLRRHLGEALPEWMIPARFCFVAALPRAPSGKVDLQALTALPLARSPAAPRPWTGAAAVLEALWCDVLGVDAVAGEDEFGALGGDSVALLEVAARAEAAGLALAPTRLGDARQTFGEVCAALSRGELGAGDRRAATELRRDVERVLSGLGPRRAGEDARGGAILVTGAAGALGSRILLELVARVGSPVVVLVRAPDDAEASARVSTAVARHGGALAEGRVRILAGDLSRPRFGLEEGAFDRLAAEVASIYHAAARVGGLLPYEALRADNVEATREVVRLAVTARRKRVHHVSTLSVLCQAEHETGVALDERNDLGATLAVLGGYAQSKWAAEHLVRAAGVPGCVFRLGLLAPSDHLARFFRGLRDLGCAPSGGAPLALDLTPVDHAARAIVTLAEGTSDDTFHLANPHPADLADLVGAARAAGAAIEDAPAEAFRARAHDRIRASADAALAYLSLSRALGDASLERHRGLDLFEATGVHLGLDRTLTALAAAGLRPPPPARDLLRDQARAAYA